MNKPEEAPKLIPLMGYEYNVKDVTLLKHFPTFEKFSKGAPSFIKFPPKFPQYVREEGITTMGPYLLKVIKTTKIDKVHEIVEIRSTTTFAHPIQKEFLWGNPSSEIEFEYKEKYKKQSKSAYNIFQTLSPHHSKKI